MQKLDYQVPAARIAVSPAVCVLVALPIVSAVSAFLSAANWVSEPFGAVDLMDVVLFFGAPVMAFASAVTWCFIARGRRLPWRAFVLALVWFGVMLYCSINSLLPYFREPWNR